MSSTATVISLTARPSQIAHLCFPVDGIIQGFRSGIHRKVEEILLVLGSQVSSFDFTSFYANLGETTSQSPVGLSRLKYDSDAVLNDPKVQASLLVTLRAEPAKAALDKAIVTRQNAYFAKYANGGQIQGVMQQFYSSTAAVPTTAISKPDLLAALSSVSQSQADSLQDAYLVSAVPLVVQNTNSVAQTTFHSSGTVGETQAITNTGYTYRTPVYECQAQWARAQISLIDQQFAQFMAGQNLQNLDTVFRNELHSIDLDVKRFQVAYLNTILMSPIDGVVTGIYKNPGDWVRAGETVVRIENNNNIFLVGTVKFRGFISIGFAVTVSTTLFDSPNQPPQPVTVTGVVVSARGSRDEDDRWDVIVSCENTAAVSGQPVPPGYHFDYDNTTLTVN